MLTSGIMLYENKYFPCYGISKVCLVTFITSTTLLFYKFSYWRHVLFWIELYHHTYIYIFT